MKIVGNNIIRTDQDITDQDRLKAVMDAWTGTLWGWFAVVEAEFGKEKAVQLLNTLMTGFANQMVTNWLTYFGVEEMTVPMMSETANIIHELWGFKAPWTIASDNEGFETIEYCPVRHGAPEPYKNDCYNFCKPVTGLFYPGLAKSKCTCVLEKSKARGDIDCKVSVKIHK